MSSKPKCEVCGDELIKPIQHTLADGAVVCSTKCVRDYYKKISQTPPVLPNIIAQFRKEELEATHRCLSIPKH